MKTIAMVPRVKVSADGDGVVSHAGVGLLREVADLSGLTGGVSAVLADTYKGPWLLDPGRVFTDLAAAVASNRRHLATIGVTAPTKPAKSICILGDDNIVARCATQRKCLPGTAHQVRILDGR